jgi:hypothetical protein
MINIFKSNSRFSSLIDDIPQQKKDSKNDEKKEPEDSYNSFKSERNLRSEYGYRGFSDKGRERYRLNIEAEIKAQKELDEKEKERIREESMKTENFPYLVSNSNKEKKELNLNTNYIEKLKKEKIQDNIDKDLVNLKPGWVLYKRDPLTKGIITKQHPKTYIEVKKEKSENEIATDSINALVKLHKKRTDEYIENYGYDEWEKMFKFSDWRECEAYLEEMEEMEDGTDVSDYENDDYEEDDYDY